MYTRRWTANFLNTLIVHLPDGVGEWSSRVDDALRFNIPFLASQFVL